MLEGSVKFGYVRACAKAFTCSHCNNNISTNSSYIKLYDYSAHKRSTAFGHSYQSYHKLCSRCFTELMGFGNAVEGLVRNLDSKSKHEVSISLFKRWSNGKFDHLVHKLATSSDIPKETNVPKILISVCPRNGKESALVREAFIRMGHHPENVDRIMQQAGGCTFAWYCTTGGTGMLRYGDHNVPVNVADVEDFVAYSHYWKTSRKENRHPTYSDFLKQSITLSTNKVRFHQGNYGSIIIPRAKLHSIILDDTKLLQTKSERRRNFIKNLKSSK